MRITCVAVVDRSGAFGGQEAVLKAIVSAVGQQVERHFSPAWGKVPVPVLLVADGSPVPLGAGLVYIVDRIVDVPGALGWHHESKEGLYCGFVAATPILLLGGSLRDGPDSVSSAVSHEVLEMLGNPGVSYWADARDGREFSMEVCDPVSGDSYDIDSDGMLVSVSNFVHPAWFDSYAPSGYWFDQMQLLCAPFVHRPTGYAVIRDLGEESEQFGHAVSALKRDQKRSVGRCARVRCVVRDTMAYPSDQA